MKIIEKILEISALAAVILFSMVTCDLNKEDDTDGPTYYKGAFKITKEQVWEGTDSNKLSEVYKRFDGNREMSINVCLSDGKGKFAPTKKLGSGKIEKGFLTCDIPEPSADDLMEWDDYKSRFFEWDDLDCNPKAKGTFLVLVTSNSELLNKEKMSGSSDSLWLESILFVYVDSDCRITGTPGEGIRPGDAFYETQNLDLKLKSGWNTVCEKQLLEGDRGVEADSMTIKNPNDFKWAIRNHP